MTIPVWTGKSFPSGWIAASQLSPLLVPKKRVVPRRPIPTTLGLARSDKLADRLYEQILQRISGGSWREGSRLPAENELAAQYQVSRPVVREALARLRADGIVRSRRGAGSFVERRPSRELVRVAPGGGIADLMRCFEFRIALEGEAAAFAAQRRTAAHLAEIDAAFHRLDRVIARGELGVEEDIRFHAVIVAAARNPMFDDALAALAALILQGISLTRALSLRASGRRVRLVQAEHAKILAAIRDEEPDAARAAMRQHIENARTRVLSDSAEPSTH